MADHSGKSIIDLAMELGEKLAERKRLIEESLPPQLREGYQDPVILPDFCWAEVAQDFSPTGEDAYICASSYKLCLDCGFCKEHCICQAGEC